MTNASVILSLPDPQTTQALGRLLGQQLPTGSILLLEGDLGSGKTTLVQGLGQSLGISEPIVSPTFTLICEYPEGRIPLYHFDLYRLDPTAVEELHLESYWEGREFPLGIVAIEWAERLPNPPSDCLQLRLLFTPSGREAQLTPQGSFPSEIVDTLQRAIAAQVGEARS
ncbi:MAG: tRNA (adenosine(37)-N6)-threonylcarbamoyltransferase complex ATPase subunit type 1 TsaE [Synechococcales cyanobacterium C42_A2020_086]|jgi:tRNA threonylcarbamoyladenosine biosynthesis protein TsaE|nr:tRNA (adenosine(37)-N6)-threonylcarbamoyltransferase complex ATPase subunit type 1 TsaE [Synechococcales cyanobacterium M58_A2018_015]MBF2072368.1 tRNA (adenosine(37)-N6)-threonylcarbamoyltransferase complex ATPase subunit type 1 TsaE [Synechococcales cyanobacterium C42_A2020_086]